MTSAFWHCAVCGAVSEHNEQHATDMPGYGPVCYADMTRITEIDDLRQSLAGILDEAMIDRVIADIIAKKKAAS